MKSLKLLFIFLMFSCSLYAKEKVTLQLKWLHQFQFAGYYAAKEKGFYDEVGLDVTIKQRDLKYNNIDQVINGEAQYGVADSVLLLYKAKSEPVVIVSPIFQHSPSVLLTLKSSGINSPYALHGKDMIFYGSDTDGFSILAMLKKLGIKPNIIRERTSRDYEKLINKEVDASPAYLSNEPFYFRQDNIGINIIHPMNYGFDLYGDMLFTNQEEVKNNPERVRRFKAATLKGWEYALDNPEELIQIIQQKYNKTKSFEHLRFEARAIAKMVSKDTIPLGSIDEGRIKYIYDLYKEYGLSNKDLEIKDFIFKEFNLGESPLALTSEEQQYIKDNPTLRVQNMIAFPPFNFKENGKSLGYTVDYMKLLAKYIGVDIEFIQDKTWSESLELLKKGELDIIPQIAINSERKEFVDFSSFKHIDYVPTIAVRKELVVNSIKDLFGKKVAVLDKSFLHTLLKKRYPEVIIVPMPKPKDSVTAVSEGKVDAAMDNLSLLEFYIKKGWLSNLKTIRLNPNEGFKTTPLHVGVKKGNNVLLSIIEKAYNYLPYEDEVQLKNRWFNIYTENISRVEFSNQEMNYLENKKVLKMCVDPNWMPYEGIEKGRHVGITAEYIELFSKQLPVSIELVPTTSWSQTESYGKNRTCDFITIMSDTKERREFFNFSSKYLISPLVIATKINEPFIDNLNRVIDKEFGIVAGYSSKAIVQRAYPKLKIVDIKSIDDGLKKVDNNELYGVIDTLPTLGYLIQKNYAGNLKVTGKFDEEWSFSIATRNDEPLLDNIFSKLIENMPQEQHDAIFNRWISVKYQDNIDYTTLIWIVSVFMIVLIVVIYKNRTISQINKKMESYIQIIDEHVLTSSTDVRGRITSVSKAFSEISGYEKDELIGKSHNIVRHPDMPKELFDDLWQTITNGKTWKGEIKNRRKNGTHYWVDATISPIIDETGQTMGYTAIRHDISDKKRVEYLSITDELTTLYNKRHFNEVFEREINRVKRDEQRLGFIIFDVDHFKQYNDNYGHQKGDVVLEKIGKTLQKICQRSTDIPFRIGGEEFAVIFHPHFKESAMEFAFLIKDSIESLKIEHKYNSASCYITISMGVYTQSASGLDNSKTIYQLTDEALYEAKHQGRNQAFLVKSI